MERPLRIILNDRWTDGHDAPRHEPHAHERHQARHSADMKPQKQQRKGMGGDGETPQRRADVAELVEDGLCRARRAGVHVAVEDPFERDYGADGLGEVA